MAAESSRRNPKRPFVEEDDELSKKPPAKRVRFPKGKKVKPGDEVVDKGNVEEGEVDLTNPQVAAKAAKERANLRNQFTAELFSEDTGGIGIDLSVGEVTYEGMPDLSSKDIAVMKRRIANVLEPGETVLQALRRLKGNSDRKAKMSAETKVVFDQLTEDAMKLMENDVYHEKREVFDREAEGYEKLARAKEGPSNQHLASGEASSTGEGDYDMFADEDDNSKPSTDENNTVSQSSLDAINSGTEGGALQNDYVYDESSGYYYSSSLGYYYDPNTGLYCSAASGQWYSFNEETSTYEEVEKAASNVN
ncbi:uncharacterized protein HKW66_Vig0063650 [Vigna angularis]|uniref:OCRE domain-containing protein n=1 Tax=Phaseolus angularis TaxID=3914 RepID=A0A8T0KAH2_PHAAN|nr:uncharacterized protein HKW66_Vig0063650 [Vigna angularis]